MNTILSHFCDVLRFLIPYKYLKKEKKKLSNQVTTYLSSDNNIDASPLDELQLV